MSCGTENGWQMAEQVGYASPYRLQHLLGRAIWDEEQMCAEVRLCSRASDDGAGILAVDETSFLKRGEESVGVGRQYCGLTGQIELSSWSVSRLHQLERAELD